MENVHASRIDTAMFWAPRPVDPMGLGFWRLVTVVLQLLCGCQEVWRICWHGCSLNWDFGDLVLVGGVLSSGLGCGFEGGIGWFFVWEYRRCSLARRVFADNGG